MLWGVLLRLNLQDCTIKVVSPHQCLCEVEIKRDVTADLCRSSRYLFMYLFALAGKTFCAQTKQSSSLDYLIFNWKKNGFPSHKSVNVDKYAPLKSVTAAVPLQTKEKVDAFCCREVCPVHLSWQQDFKQYPQQKKPLGCAGVYPVVCRHILPAA